MVSVCLKLDNKWTDLHACGGEGRSRTCARNTTVTHLILMWRHHKKEARLTARLGLMGKRRRGTTFPRGSVGAALVPLFFLPEHVKERGVINFHRIRLPRENDCFSLYLATIFQFPVVFVTLNIFANEQNRGKRRRCSANFTLGPSVICIYIESIRFWFIIVTIRGVGEGRRGRLAGILSPVMRPLSVNIPERRKQGDNYGAGTKLVLLPAFTRRF